MLFSSLVFLWYFLPACAALYYLLRRRRTAANLLLLAASLITGKYENIRTAVGDKLHQNYRKRLIPNMDSLFRLCYAKGALDVYLSGAGPTIIAIVDKSNKRFACEISGILLSKMKEWKLYMLEPDNVGACILENN